MSCRSRQAEACMSITKVSRMERREGKSKIWFSSVPNSIVIAVFSRKSCTNTIYSPLFSLVAACEMSDRCEVVQNLRNCEAEVKLHSPPPSSQLLTPISTLRPFNSHQDEWTILHDPLLFPAPPLSFLNNPLSTSFPSSWTLTHRQPRSSKFATNNI